MIGILPSEESMEEDGESSLEDLSKSTIEGILGIVEEDSLELTLNGRFSTKKSDGEQGDSIKLWF
jgi:hypothetical protein